MATRSWPQQSHPQGTRGIVLLPRSSGITMGRAGGSCCPAPQAALPWQPPPVRGPALISVISGGDPRPLCAAPSLWMWLWSVAPVPGGVTALPRPADPCTAPAEPHRAGKCMVRCGAQPCLCLLWCPGLLQASTSSGCGQGSATWANGGQRPGTGAGSSESLAFPHRHTRLPEHVHPPLTAPMARTPQHPHPALGLPLTRRCLGS